MTPLRFVAGGVPVPWFDIRRHAAGHDHAWYSARFDQVEAVVTDVSAAVRDMAATGHLSRDGLTVQCDVLRANALDKARPLETAISLAIDTDRKVIGDALAAPIPLPAPEVASALLYAQNLATLRYAGPNAAPTTAGMSPILDALDRAIEAGDAIEAQVLADMLPVVVTPRGPDDVETMARMGRQQQQALRLRATAELKAAFVLQDLLDGSYDVAVGVQAKRNFVAAAIGTRLSMIVQANGRDGLVGSFTLDYPLPPGMQNIGANSVAILQSNLRQAFGAWFTV